jgi:hypothetical protein
VGSTYRSNSKAASDVGGSARLREPAQTHSRACECRNERGRARGRAHDMSSTCASCALSADHMRALPAVALIACATSCLAATPGADRAASERAPRGAVAAAAAAARLQEICCPCVGAGGGGGAGGCGLPVSLQMQLCPHAATLPRSRRQLCSFVVGTETVSSTERRTSWRWLGGSARAVLSRALVDIDEANGIVHPSDGDGGARVVHVSRRARGCSSPSPLRSPLGRCSVKILSPHARPLLCKNSFFC